MSQSKRYRENKYSEAHSRVHGYVVKIRCTRNDNNNRIIKYVCYFEGFVYDNKYRKMLSDNNKKYICLGTVYFGFHFNGKPYEGPGFVSLKLFKFPFLGISLYDIDYASIFKDKSSCRKIVRDIEKHKQEILKSSFNRNWLKSIDDIKIVKV